jgi:hypothetical protein
LLVFAETSGMPVEKVRSLMLTNDFETEVAGLAEKSQIAAAAMRAAYQAFAIDGHPAALE